jgi:hypothetical protein
MWFICSNWEKKTKMQLLLSDRFLIAKNFEVEILDAAAKT